MDAPCGARPDAFERLWPKLRAGYLLDALEHLDGKPVSPAAIPMIFYAAQQAEWSRQPSAGLGLDIRLSGERVLGSGLELELESEAIQLSVFMGSERRNRDAFGRIARLSRAPPSATSPRPGQHSGGTLHAQRIGSRV